MQKGWGQNGRFLFTMAPWYSFNWNSSLTTQQQLQSFPANTKMITNVALGNGSAAQITMPSYNGQSVAPLEVKDNPTPKYLQVKYQFPCANSTNPRISYCN